MKYARQDNESTVKFSGMSRAESVKIARAYTRIAYDRGSPLAQRGISLGNEHKEERKKRHRREIMVMENV